MSNLQKAIFQLKEDMIEMTRLVRAQVARGKEAFVNGDLDLALEIKKIENRVNAMELHIDQQCENIIALYNPVAIDLRFVMAMMKSNTDLERMADNVEGIANYILGIGGKFDEKIVEAFRVVEEYDICLSMFDDAIEAFIRQNSKQARKLFRKDDLLDEINRTATGIAPDMVRKHPEQAEQILAAISIVRKLERIGDQVTNLAEEIIFYLDAKVLKHTKPGKKERN